MKLTPVFLALALSAIQLAVAIPAEEIHKAVADEKAKTEHAQYGPVDEDYGPPPPPVVYERPRPPPDFCAEAMRATVPVYQLFNKKQNDNFYTTNFDEYNHFLRSGFSQYRSMTPWLVLGRRLRGTVPIYRMYNNRRGIWDHFYTTSESERTKMADEGYVDEGILGYAFLERRCDTLPLEQLYLDHFHYTRRYTKRVYRKKRPVFNHVYTIDTAESEFLRSPAQQYRHQGYIGYVFPPNTGVLPNLDAVAERW